MSDLSIELTFEPGCGRMHAHMDNTAPIVFYNRYTGQLEEEKILGERGLRWVYGSSLGQLSLHVLLKRAFFFAADRSLEKHTAKR